jgi:chemotaxis response regulator CheB
LSTLTQQAALAVSPGFQARVRAAMVTEAAAVLALPADPGHPQQAQLRGALALEVLTNPAPYLERFAWACVTTAPVRDQIAPSLTGITVVTHGAPAAVTTSSPHGLATGATVVIDGTTGGPNGTWSITVTGPSAFTIPVAVAADLPAGGTVTAQPDDPSISTAVHAVWSSIAGVQPGMV